MCGAPIGGTALQGLDINKEAVIVGRVTHDGANVSGAFVRLLDSTGEFTAEVVTDAEGIFRFTARDGAWTVRALAPGGLSGQSEAADVAKGRINQADIALA
jgi:uncharacterized GH25 family protein